MDNKDLPVERQMLTIFKYWDELHKKYERAKSKQLHNAKMYANCLVNCRRLERQLGEANAELKQIRTRNIQLKNTIAQLKSEKVKRDLSFVQRLKTWLKKKGVI